MDKRDNRIGKTGFWCYCFLMVWLLYGQRMGNIAGGPYMEQLIGNLNLVPLRTIRNYISVAQWTKDAGLLRHIVVNLVGNVVMFIPLGFFLPLNWNRFRSFRKLILFSLLLIALVEIVQLVSLLGSLDVDDLILNLSGVAIGYVIWRVRGK